MMSLHDITQCGSVDYIEETLLKHVDNINYI